jgi:hypothetical protein
MCRGLPPILRLWMSLRQNQQPLFTTLPDLAFETVHEIGKPTGMSVCIVQALGDFSGAFSVDMPAASCVLRRDSHRESAEECLRPVATASPCASRRRKKSSTSIETCWSEPSGRSVRRCIRRAELKVIQTWKPCGSGSDPRRHREEMPVCLQAGFRTEIAILCPGEAIPQEVGSEMKSASPKNTPRLR